MESDTLRCCAACTRRAILLRSGKRKVYPCWGLSLRSTKTESFALPTKLTKLDVCIISSVDKTVFFWTHPDMQIMLQGWQYIVMHSQGKWNMPAPVTISISRGRHHNASLLSSAFCHTWPKPACPVGTVEPERDASWLKTQERHSKCHLWTDLH